MDVLRRLLAALVPGGVVVDLTMSQLDESFEAEGELLGHLDGRLFFPRALATQAGLDALADEELLVLEREDPVTVIVRYPSGSDALEDIAERPYTRMPPELAKRLAAIRTECLLYSNCLVRTFTKR